MKYLKKILIAFFTISLVLSCSLESEYALPNNEKIAPELIGKWTDPNNKNDVLKFTKKNRKMYNVSIKVNEEKPDELSAFINNIDGHLILNLIEKTNDSTTNLFYKISVHQDQLTYYEVNDKLVKSEIQSQKDLLQFFQNNIDHKEFFINPTVLHRQ